MHRIPLWAIGPLLLYGAAFGTSNPADADDRLALTIIGAVLTLLLTVPAALRLRHRH